MILYVGHGNRVRLVVTQVIAMAGVGLLLGWTLSTIDLRSLMASRHECAGNDGMCFGWAAVIGPAIGFAITIAVCWLGFAVIRIRPLLASVPIGIMLTAQTLVEYLNAIPGGRLAPTWGLAVSMMVGFALLATAFTAIRTLRIIGIVTFVLLLVVSWPSAIALHDHLHG